MNEEEAEKYRKTAAQYDTAPKTLVAINQLIDRIDVLLKETKEQGIRSTNMSRFSLGISIGAFLIAIAAAFFALQDSKTDKQWQEKQLEAYVEILESIEPETVE